MHTIACSISSNPNTKSMLTNNMEDFKVSQTELSNLATLPLKSGPDQPMNLLKSVHQSMYFKIYISAKKLLRIITK